MAQKYELVAKVLGDTSDFNNAMESMGVTAGAAAGAVIIAITATTAAVAKLGHSLITSAKNYEDLEASIRGSIGDIKEADKWLKIINDTAAQSTENNIQLGETFRTLFAFSGANLAKEFEFVTSRAMLLDLSLKEVSAGIGSMFTKLQSGDLGILETLRSQNIAQFFGEEGKKSIEALVKSGASAGEVMSHMLDVIRQVGEEAKKLRQNTASGKENILLGLLDFRQAEQGSGALEQYKDLLDQIISLIQGGNFDKIGDAFERMFEAINMIVGGSGFDSWLELVINHTVAFIDAITTIIITFGLLLKVLEPVAIALNAIQDAFDSITDKALDLIMPGTDHAAPTKQQIEDAKLAREANQRIIHNYTNGAPAQ